jgi:hypothetical protein
VTCNPLDLAFELINMRSIQDLTIKPNRETKMRKSSRIAFLSMLLVAAASPGLGHTNGIEMGSALGAKPMQRAAPAVSRDGWVGALRWRPKACSYRGGPKTGMWSCEQTYDLTNGGNRR